MNAGRLGAVALALALVAASAENAAPANPRPRTVPSDLWRAYPLNPAPARPRANAAPPRPPAPQRPQPPPTTIPAKPKPATSAIPKATTSAAPRAQQPTSTIAQPNATPPPVRQSKRPTASAQTTPSGEATNAPPAAAARLAPAQRHANSGRLSLPLIVGFVAVGSAGLALGLLLRGRRRSSFRVPLRRASSRSVRSAETAAGWPPALTPPPLTPPAPPRQIQPASDHETSTEALVARQRHAEPRESQRAEADRGGDAAGAAPHRHVAPQTVSDAPAQHPMPAAAPPPLPAAEAAPPREASVAEITVWRGYTKVEFHAVLLANPRVVIASSPGVRWRSGTPPNEAVREAHAKLVEALGREGWEPCGEGENWYQIRFSVAPTSYSGTNDVVRRRLGLPG